MPALSEIPAATTLTDDDQLYLLDGSNSRRITIANFRVSLTISQSQISDLSSFLENLVEDSTPQLGGNLDMNGRSIISTSNANINILPNGTGNVVLGNMEFDSDQSIGASQDDYVLTYDDATGLISLKVNTAGDMWGDAVDDDIVPDGDGTRDLGSSSNRFAELHIDTFEVNGSTTITGFTGTDATLVSGTAGTDGDFAVWNSDGDIVDGPTPPSGALVGTTDTQTLTNKTLTTPRVTHTVRTDADNYTMVIGDQSAIIVMTSSSANELTIPSNASVAFPVGTKMEVWSTGSGTTTIAAASGVTLSGNGGSATAGSCDIQSQYGGATLSKIDTNIWMVGGDIDAVS